MNHNDVFSRANNQSDVCQQLQDKVAIINEQDNDLDRQEYMAKDSQAPFNSGQRPSLEFKVRKLESEYEGAAKKMDMLSNDQQLTVGSQLVY